MWYSTKARNFPNLPELKLHIFYHLTTSRNGYSIHDSPWDSQCTTEENSQQIYDAITNSHTRLEKQHKNRISIESPTLLSYELHTSLSVLQPKELSSCLLFAASYPPPSTKLHYESH